MTAVFVHLLPLWGAIAIALAVAPLRGSARRMTLAIAPLLLGFVMWWAMPGRSPDGNWLRDLSVMAVYGLGFLGIGVYYVAFLVFAIGSWLRRNQQLREAARESEA